MEITRHSDIGTPERHQKPGGIQSDNIDGQLRSKGLESYLDLLVAANIFNQSQYDAVYQLIRDYQAGILYKWQPVKDFAPAASQEDAEEERERRRRAYNEAIRHDREFLKLSNLAHLTITSIASLSVPLCKLQLLADRLDKYYKNI